MENKIMATYLEKKREAIGFELPPADPFAGGSVFDVSGTMGTMQGSGHITNFDKLLKEEIDEQSKLKEILEFRWDTEYATDRTTAKKNLDKLREYLLAGNCAKTTQHLANKPAAEWLNYVFLNVTEVNDLIGLFKKNSPECREVVTAAIKKELDRLVNFKTLLELIIEDMS